MVGVSGAAPRQGTIRGARGRRRGRRRTLLDGGEAGRVRDRVRAPRLRRHLVHDRAAAGLVQHVLRLARRGARPHAAEVPAPHPGRHPPAHRRVAALAPGRRGRGGRARAALRPDLRRLRRRPEGLHAVLPARGHHSPGARLGARRPAAHRRRRPHHEPGRRHRRQRGDRHRGGGGAGALSAPRPRPDRARSTCAPCSACARPTCARCTACSSAPSACCSARAAQSAS